MIDLKLILLRDHWSIYVNRNLNRRHLYWYFHPPFNLNWSINVNRFININRFLYNCRNLNSIYDFTRWFIRRLNRHLFLHLNIFRNLDNLLNNSFRTWYIPRNFYNNLNWFFNNNLFNNLFRNLYS